MELRCFRVGTWSSVGWARSWVLLQHSCEGHDLHCMPWAGGLSVTLGQLLLLGKPTREDTLAPPPAASALLPPTFPAEERPALDFRSEGSSSQSLEEGPPGKAPPVLAPPPGIHRLVGAPNIP